MNATTSLIALGTALGAPVCLYWLYLRAVERYRAAAEPGDHSVVEYAETIAPGRALRAGAHDKTHGGPRLPRRGPP